MINKIAVHLATKLSEIVECNMDEYEIYVYSLETLLGQMITYAFLILAGILFESLPQIATYTIFLVALQGQTGGYHARTHAGCISCSWIIGIIVIAIVKLVSFERFALFLPALFISIIYIVLRAPINHIKLNLSTYEMKHLCKLSRRVLLLEVVIVFLFLLQDLRSLCFLRV